jgi:type VI secretion system protein ImpK
MRNVCELFADLFAYGRLFEQQSYQGTFQPSYEDVRNTIATLLEEQDANAQRTGLSASDYQEARFAVVAWLDETILHHTHWQHHQQWKTFPLQLEYYQTKNAVNEVLERLGRLGAEQQQVREIYYQCFDLQLIGRYFFNSEAEQATCQPAQEHVFPPAPTLRDKPGIGQSVDKFPQERRIIKHAGLLSLLRRLSARSLGHRDSSSPLTTAATAPGQPKKHPARLAGYLRYAVLAVLLGGSMVWFLMYFYAWKMPVLNPPNESVQLAPPPPAPLPLEPLLWQWLYSQQEPLQCSRITRLAVDELSGHVHLEGRIASEAQRFTLHNGLQHLRGVTQVSDALQLVPRPLCEVFALLESYGAGASIEGLSVQFNNPGQPPVYYENDNLVIELNLPATWTGYVYVDYYTTDQAVWHVFPNPNEPQNAIQPGHPHTIGAVGGPLPWRVVAPFGLELVTVVVSKTPLFAQPRYGIEPASTFLPVLQQVLATHHEVQTEVAVSLHLIVTRGR